MVVGLNYSTAPVAVRERFWIDENRRYEALFQLSRAEGVDEVIILSTCNRTEFYLWAEDVTLAANSVMRLLGAKFALQLSEWKYFYRLLDEAALLHIFRVASCIESWLVGAPQIVPRVKQAWEQAQKVGASGRFLDAVLQKAFAVSERVRRETAIGEVSVSIPFTAVEFARQIFGSLENKNIVLIGAGAVSELSAHGLINQGGSPIRLGVTNRTFENAAELAAKLGGNAIPYEDRWRHMADADIIISSTSCPHTILSRQDVERIVSGRPNRPLVILDLALPRDVDAAVRNVKGVYLCDLDDLENVPDPTADARDAAAAEAQKLLQDETRGFLHTLTAKHTVPTVLVVRTWLDDFCRQELDAFRQENGPFSKDQDEILNAVMSRMTQRLAGSFARELKELPVKDEEEQLKMALQRLFHLPSPQVAIAGTRN